jgi:beta-lactamase regulating signal transducer with metallopeptidase domain
MSDSRRAGQRMPKRLWLAFLIVGVVLAAPATATFVAGSLSATGAQSAAAFDKSSNPAPEHAAAVPAAARVNGSKSYRANPLLSWLAAAWAILVVALWLTRARLRVDTALVWLVSVRPRGPPVLSIVS